MENTEMILTWLKIVSMAVTIISVVFTGLWAYLVFIVGRGLLPAVQFDIAVEQLGKQGEKYNMLDICFLIENKGQYPLVVTDLKTKIRYIENEDLGFEQDIQRPHFGRPIFPRSLGAMIQTGDPLAIVMDTSLPIVPHQTFVQPGIIQHYNFATALPIDAEYLLVKGMFTYGIKPLTALSKILVGFGSWIGVIPFTFEQISKAHSVERVVRITG